MRNNKNNISFSVRNITLNHKILISFYRNLTSHFTDKEKIITSTYKILTLRFKNITLCLSILIFSLLNIINTFTYISNTSALDYSSNVGIGFTFNPTLSISLSSNDLVISNLVPGGTLDSNSINVSVATNAAYGYTLSANVNDENLVHSNNVDIFGSIATNADLASLDTDNTWGYTSKLNNETVWNNYNGLSSFSNTILLDNSNAADSTGSIDFKIAAKASNTQPSGEYTGTINFIAITKLTPMNLAESYFAHGKTRYNGYYTMQDMTTEICNDTEIIGEGSQTELIDIRDNKVYWATKLADNHCWMTQNLDLDLSHDRPLTSEDTDLNDGSLSGAYAENYTYDPETKVVTWAPNNTTYSYKNKTGTKWIGNDNTAYSLDPGVWYWNANDNTLNCNYLTTTCEDFAQTPYSNNGAHGAVGNYYNWSAAIASDDSSSLTEGTYDNINNNPHNSICPKGWRLPTISSQQSSITNSTNEFARLNNLYNEDKTSTDYVWVNNPLWFVRSGFIYGSFYSMGLRAFYWSSTIHNDTHVRSLMLRVSSVVTALNDDDSSKSNGMSVRCLAR